MAIMVTGGAGNIGSHALRLLGERGRQVVALDSVKFGHRSAVGDVPLVKGDVSDPQAVTEAVEWLGIDAMIHFAAYKSPAESMLEPQRYFGNKAAKTASLIDTLHRAGIGRIVFSSTCAV
jgi:UDP-glucose 4-epimerase